MEIYTKMNLVECRKCSVNINEQFNKILMLSLLYIPIAIHFDVTRLQVVLRLILLYRCKYATVQEVQII